MTGYPEYEHVIEQARAAARGFTDPATIRAHQDVIARRGTDWCTAVLGRSFAGLHAVSVVEAHMLDVADRLDIDPPLPPQIIGARAEETRRRRADADRVAAMEQRRAAARADALETCAVPVEVRPNVHQGVHGNRREALRHVVPLADAAGARRVHAAGRALCDAGRARPLRLSGPTSEPATCQRCVTAAAVLRDLATRAR